MARAMEAEVVSELLPLRGWDKDEMVQFERPTRGVEQAVSRVQASAEMAYEMDGTRVLRNRPSIVEQEDEMMAHSLVYCSVRYKSGDRIFNSGANCKEPGKPITADQKIAFYQTWQKLDPDLAEAMMGELREWHPPFNIWGAPPPQPPQSNSSKDSSGSAENTSESSKSGDSSTTSGPESTE